MLRSSLRQAALILVTVCGGTLSAWAQPAEQLDPQQLEFFEAKIRPVLVEHCYECHSAGSDPIQGGLLLDSAAALLRGGDSGPGLVAGQPADSLLLSALRYEGLEMPPDAPLDDRMIQDFEKWIQHGAVDPRTETHPAPSSAELDIEQRRDFWAFRKPQPADLAEDNYSDRIDALVNQQLEAVGIQPNPAAPPAVLLRRLYLDLTGLPPTAQQFSDFETQHCDDAFEQTVDQLLASDHYGERWTRLWLDIARYAEDQAHIVGNNKALFYPNAWMYRDWLIASLNGDLPYDQFIRLQLAADQLPDVDRRDLAALGFIGLGPKYYRRNDPEVMADEWEDRVDVVSRGLLGLTVACARCHDHKYDAIPTEDYYALAGVFAGTEMFNRPLDDTKEVEKNGHAKSPEEALHVVRDSKPRDLPVMIRGDVKNPGEIVPRGFLQVLFPGPRRTFQQGSGRLELAECIVTPDNPLTARVIVNRVWQQYFGRGLVATTSNFGELGERPSHPALLDDLAAGFMQHGWSLKWLHRQIVLSGTYQRSSAVSQQAAAADRDNRWLWRVPRRRLSVEAWRDAVLQVSGQLDSQVGGKSIKAADPGQTRRSVYAEVSRFELDSLLSLFDFPDPNTHASRRVETNTPLQKLFLLNSPFMVTHAGHTVAQLDLSASDNQIAQQLFRRVLGRSADVAEAEAAVQFVQTQPQDGWQQMAQVLLSSNEFWIVD
jgi:hypothetical protein